MCIAVPAKVMSVSDGYAKVDVGKERREVRSDILHPKAGDWVLVFGNQIIDVITKEKARELIRSMESAYV